MIIFTITTTTNSSIEALPLVHSATHKHMPDVLIGSLEAAEADADTQKALSSPHVARGDGGLPQL